MLESLRIIIDETMEIYMLATLDGRLFIPFFLCLIYIFATGKKEDDVARRYLVYPSLVLLFFLFNPVLIHFVCKYIGVPERVVRMYWPLPMDLLFIYCLIRLLSGCRAIWKKALVLMAAVLLLYMNAGTSMAGQSYGVAENPQKLPKGTREVSDVLYSLNGGEDPYVILPSDLFFWIREYNPYIRMPYVRDVYKLEQDSSTADLDTLAEMALEGGCDFIVVTTAQQTEGDLTEHGFKEKARIEAQDFQYVIYQLCEQAD